MQVGDIFTVDDAAIAALEKAGYSVEWAVGQKENKVLFRLKSGMQFRIARDGLKLMPSELRASRLAEVAGQPDVFKAIRGRPRKFPGQLVADLMGETLSVLSAPPVAAPAPTPAIVTPQPAADVVDEDGQTTTDFTPLAKAEQTDEDRAASEKRVKALFGAMPNETGKDNW